MLRKLRAHASIVAAYVLVLTAAAFGAVHVQRDHASLHRQDCEERHHEWVVVHDTILVVTEPIELRAVDDAAARARLERRNAQLADERRRSLVRLGPEPRDCE